MRRRGAEEADSPPSEMSEDEDGGGGGGDRWMPDLRGGNGGGGGGCGGRWAPPDQVLENVLESVLEFLTAARDRNAASLVCRSWYRAEAQTRRELFIGNCYAVSPRRAVERFGGVRAVVLKGKPRFADFSLVPYGWGAYVSPWVAALGPAYPRLERICLKRMTISNDDLALVAKSFPLFKELSLVCCDGFSTQGLAAVAERCRYLRVLDLIEDYIDEEEDELVDWISKFPESNRTLESLVFDCVSVPFNFQALEALVARSPALRRLRMNHHVTVEQLRRLMAKAPQLTHLGTGAFRSEPGPGGALSVTELATSFAASRSLTCLSGFRDVNPEFLPAIHPVCANLTSLNFSFANLTAEELTPIIRNCVRLRTFWVLDTVGDEGLRAVAETCSDLRELRVFPFDATEDSEGSVSDVGLQAISEGCQKLESILYFCQRMTNAAVIAMSKNCPDLVTFRLCIMGRHRPDRITGEPMDDGFGAIVMNCKKLTRLSVSGLLTDKAFAYIGKYGKLIKTLSVAFAGNSDMSLQSVFEGCSRLQKLEVRDSPFSDKGLLSGLSYFYNMRFLWMNSCRLTMRGCRQVAQQMPDLVVEVMKDHPDDEGEMETVDKLYLYRSLAGPRNDAPPFVNIL
uniref:F-box domain-containing protein n=1 Tax=Oryza brachyantha TaxID=4533 RepID=J3LHA6_ORYBR